MYLISLELATERVWVPSKFACCLSNLCLAATTLRSQFRLHCGDLSRRSDKLRSKWCLSARDRARAPASNSAVILKGAYITNVNGKPIFTKEDAISALCQLHDERLENMTVDLAPECKMSSQALWKAVAEHNIFQPEAPLLGENQHDLTISDVCSIAAACFPDIDFS